MIEETEPDIKVWLQLVSSWQKEDCPFKNTDGSAYKHEAEFEAVTHYGNTLISIRCCRRPEHQEKAKELARKHIEVLLQKSARNRDNR